MQLSLLTFGMIAGGLGLFMLAVMMITDGLKLAAGNSLRNMLGKWTRSPVQGIFAGISITAIVQSSSAVTVAIIGFVNAGIISMYHALGVVYGANIGTTMTGWLVAIVGFKINIELFALPLIGIGMLLRLTGSDSRRAPLGLAIVGFGLFFIGIDVLKDAFEGLATTIDFNKITVTGISGVFIFVGIGFFMTVVTQSSSAAIAIILTAATGGILGLNAAAAMVVGANVGTTSTAALAVIGATPNAKRVAAAHIVFNVITGGVALITLPVLFWIIKITGSILGLQDIPAVTLALFHTIFNILGVLIMWPVSKKLTRFLETRFVTQEEIEGRPRFLDKTVAVSPVLAISALVLELSRIAAVVRRMSLATLSLESTTGTRIKSDHIVVDKLSSAVAEFITRLEKGGISGEHASQLAKLLSAEQHLLACADQVLIIAREQTKLDILDDVELGEGIAHFRSEVTHLMELANPEIDSFSFEDCKKQLESVQTAYENIKASLLSAGAELRIPIPQMIAILDQNSRIRRMARQMYKAIIYLGEMNLLTQMQTPQSIEAKMDDISVENQ